MPVFSSVVCVYYTVKYGIGNHNLGKSAAKNGECSGVLQCLQSGHHVYLGCPTELKYVNICLSESDLWHGTAHCVECRATCQKHFCSKT